MVSTDQIIAFLRSNEDGDIDTRLDRLERFIRNLITTLDDLRQIYNIPIRTIQEVSDPRMRNVLKIIHYVARTPNDEALLRMIRRFFDPLSVAQASVLLQIANMFNWIESIRKLQVIMEEQEVIEDENS